MTTASVSVNPSAKQKIYTPPSAPPFPNMVWVPGGTFTMGSESPAYPEEGPTRQITVSGFWMDQYPITNKQFQKFVQATDYVTLAEKAPKAEDYPNVDPALLVPGSTVFIKPEHPVNPQRFCWWHDVPGAYWRQPEGPGSSLQYRENHPVVHLAYEDAIAYADWAGKTLPTEAQWEFAARGGLEGATFTWGNEFKPDGQMMANIWQGQFPHQNLKSHPPRTEPIGDYPANGYGLYDMVGNVWEWTRDWYRERHPDKPKKACCIPIDPKGGSELESIDRRVDPSEQKPRKVLKGGSFLCAPNYCTRYRPAARHPETIDTSTNHIGFRTIVEV